MRKLATITTRPGLAALPVVLALALAGCGGGHGPTADGGRAPAPAGVTTEPRSPAAAVNHRPPSTEPPATVAAPPSTAPPTAPPTTTAPVEPAVTSPPPPPATGPQFVCPAGGMDELTALQQAVDEGHQPWRLSAEDVAASCTFGVPTSTVEPAGPDRYRVTDGATGDSVLVDVAQPLGPGTIWAVTSVTPA